MCVASLIICVGSVVGLLIVVLFDLCLARTMMTMLCLLLSLVLSSCTSISLSGPKPVPHCDCPVAPELGDFKPRPCDSTRREMDRVPNLFEASSYCCLMQVGLFDDCCCQIKKPVCLILPVVGVIDWTKKPVKKRQKNHNNFVCVCVWSFVLSHELTFCPFTHTWLKKTT